MTNIAALLPIFDSLEHFADVPYSNYLSSAYHLNDIEQAHQFLQAYTGSKGTFNSYRREIERLLHWCALIEKKKLMDLKRQDIEAFITFCQSPPKNWIGTQKPPRFTLKNGKRTPNPAWKPFVATRSKAEHRQGLKPSAEQFELSQGALREMFAILSSFFKYLVQEEYTLANPVASIRQKSKFLRKHQGGIRIRRLSELQWQYVIETTENMAVNNPEHERSLFIMSALYGMYLRISELAASERWEPRMNDFARDTDGNWWFTTVSKGNKERHIAVSDSMLNALKRWRQHLGLSQLPSPADTSPLLPKLKGKGPMQSINQIRKIVQYCFDQAMDRLKHDGFNEEAETLLEATVHWLRHTGISDDVKHRPREHVRDDAGHSSSAITDRYIDIELRERHKSAKKKLISQ